MNGFGSASRIFVSSPEPEHTKSPSPSVLPSPPSPPHRDRDRDRGHERTHTPTYTNRPDRVQVLPTGPNHTFKSGPFSAGLTGTSSTPFKARTSPVPAAPPTAPMSRMGSANATFLERERAHLLEESAPAPVPPSPPLRRRYTQRIEVSAVLHGLSNRTAHMSGAKAHLGTVIF